MGLLGKPSILGNPSHGSFGDPVSGKFLPDLSSLRCCPSGECTFDDSTGATLDETNFPFGRVLLLLPQRLRLGSNRFVYRCIYTRGFVWGWFSARFQSSNSCFFLGKFYNKKKRLQENNIYITILQDFAEQNHPAQGGKKLSVWIFPLVRLVNLSICKCYRKCYHTSPPSCIVLSLIRLRNTCASALNFSQVMTDADCEPPSTRTKVEIS